MSAAIKTSYDALTLDQAQWEEIAATMATAVALLGSVRWQDMDSAPKDRAILARDEFGTVRSVHWFEPWGNWQPSSLDLGIIDAANDEYHGIGVKVLTGWMELPVAEPVLAPALGR